MIVRLQLLQPEMQVNLHAAHNTPWQTWCKHYEVDAPSKLHSQIALAVRMDVLSQNKDVLMSKEPSHLF